MTNTRKLLAASAALALGALTSTAFADPKEDNPNGAYVGGGWGQFRLDIDGFSEVTDTVNDISESDDNAWKLFAGYRFNPYIAVEAAYLNFGEPGDDFETSGTDGNYRVELSGFSPYIIGSVPLGPVELSARVGYYFYDVDVHLDLDDPGPDVDSKHSDSDFIYGAAVGVTFFNHLHAQLEYEVINIDSDIDANAVWLTGAYRF